MKVIQLTDTQIMMIKTINQAKEEITTRIANAEKDTTLTDEERKVIIKKLQDRFAELSEQLVNAQKPVKRTPEEEDKINKVIEKIRSNMIIKGAEMEQENINAGQTMSAKQKFFASIKQLSEDLKERYEVMQRQYVYQQESLELIKKNSENFSDLDCVQQDVEMKVKLIADIKITMELCLQKINMYNTMNTWLEDNYESVMDLNFYVGNVFRVEDYDNRITEIKERAVKNEI